MELTQDVIRDVNLAVESIASEKYYYEKQYDEEGHSFDMRWEDCVSHAVDDFQLDVGGWMGCRGYELSAEEESEIGDYAFNNVNVSTVRKYSEGM